VHQLPRNETSLPHTAVFHLTEPRLLFEKSELILNIESANVGRVRLSVTPIADAIPGWPAADERLMTAVNAPAKHRDPQYDAILASEFHRGTTAVAKQQPIAKQAREDIAGCRAGLAMTLIAQALPAEKLPVSRVLPRGNWQDISGDLAPPSTPHFLPVKFQNSPERLTRLELADWLVSRDNPLVSRHFANRIWKHFFGTGLSANLDDLGSQGEWPSHPQLLDWLAADFIDTGWDIKHLVRQLVTSRTYRQSAAVRKDLLQLDPYNRLLAQQSARRLEAEIIRDNALSISGLLEDSYIGGPSVFPYQPAGHYSNLQFPNRTYKASEGFRQYRRGVYMHWQRTFLHPMLVNFDAPSRDECTADRTLSNSPQQALTLLNDPTFVEASLAFAKRLQSQQPSGDFQTTLTAAFELALARGPSPREVESLNELYDAQLLHYQSNPEDTAALLKSGKAIPGQPDAQASQLAAWSQVCRVILNLHETITRY